MIPKFRAWDKELKQMVYDVQATYDGLEYSKANKDIDIDSYDWMDCFESWLNNNRFEVAQSTGIEDKNGKEIYVGDYIKYLGKTYQVIQDYTGAFAGKRKEFGEESLFICYIYTECEVIGNIYQTLEEN